MSREEIVTVVDERNNAIGQATRSEMRRRGLCHRATYILVFDDQKRLFVQKRTSTKDIYPGYYDAATGGVVLAGESYQKSARRELAEELGIRGVPLTPRFDFFHRDGENRVWGRVFDCKYDGEIVLQAEEVESGDFYSIAAISEMSRRHPFTPDGLYVLRRYLETNTSGNMT